MKRTQRWQDWVNLILGIWLFISPWVTGYGHTFFSWDAFLFGALIMTFSVWALSSPRIWEEWFTLIIGIWVFISPWVLEFATMSVSWSFFVVGALVLILSLWAMSKPNAAVTHKTVPLS